MLSLFDQGPFRPCLSPFNLAAHVLRHCQNTPDKLALSILDSHATQDWTYSQLEAAVRGTGTGLLQAGVRPGDIVLLRLGNTVEFPIAYLGCITAGCVPVPTSSQLTELETAKIISDLAPAVVLRDPDVPCAAHPSQISTDSLRAMWSLPPCEFQMGDPNRLAYVVYTSGTGGNPRAVGHAHRAIWARQMMVDGWYDLKPNDRLLHAGAFNWTYTLGTGLMDPWASGATALIPTPGTDPQSLPDLLRRHGATIFAGAPGVYRKFLDSGLQLDLPDLRHGLSAGEKLSAAVADRWHAATGTRIFEAYGMSECSTFISSCPSHSSDVAALGFPQTGRRVAIVDKDGPVPLGHEGTIAIHGDDPGLMLGYLNAPEETKSRMQDGWFLTGDQGTMRADGQITYLGRDDDMMNAGGFRVSPLEVESVINSHDGVEQSGVAAVEVKPDTFVIVAFYTGAADVTEDMLNRFAQQRLARYKQPRAYVHLDALPTGANNKILRRALPALYKALKQ